MEPEGAPTTSFTPPHTIGSLYGRRRPLQKFHSKSAMRRQLSPSKIISSVPSPRWLTLEHSLCSRADCCLSTRWLPERYSLNLKPNWWWKQGDWTNYFHSPRIPAWLSPIPPSSNNCQSSLVFFRFLRHLKKRAFECGLAEYVPPKTTRKMPRYAGILGGLVECLCLLQPSRRRLCNLPDGLMIQYGQLIS